MPFALGNFGFRFRHAHLAAQEAPPLHGHVPPLLGGPGRLRFCSRGLIRRRPRESFQTLLPSRRGRRGRGRFAGDARPPGHLVLALLHRGPRFSNGRKIASDQAQTLAGGSVAFPASAKCPRPWRKRRFPRRRVRPSETLNGRGRARDFRRSLGLHSRRRFRRFRAARRRFETLRPPKSLWRGRRRVFKAAAGVEALRGAHDRPQRSARPLRGRVSGGGRRRRTP
mmetsp:Transcript_31994/g.107705  ORF Transcript_31994/g.107705 Transcript_31994/m.107705 type:complete len:225 (-) Transcript_31994:2163-2837(-)